MDIEEKKEEGQTGIIEPVEIDHEMRTAYIDYSMSVIVSRALPDVRDGLKPVAEKGSVRNGRPRLCHIQGLHVSAPRSSARCSVSTTRTATPVCMTLSPGSRSLGTSVTL